MPMLIDAEPIPHRTSLAPSFKCVIGWHDWERQHWHDIPDAVLQGKMLAYFATHHAFDVCRRCHCTRAAKA